jgi:hypothetical protein
VDAVSISLPAQKTGRKKSKNTTEPGYEAVNAVATDSLPTSKSKKKGTRIR